MHFWYILYNQAMSSTAGHQNSAESPIRAISECMLRTAPGSRAVIAVDGVDGSGKTTFAANLATMLRARPVLVLHADDFLNPSSERHARGRTSPEGFWLDTYNYEAMFSYALDPLRNEGDGWYRARSYDRRTDRTIEPPAQPAAPDALILVEGMFLHRDELRDRWDLSVFLDVPFSETARRMAERDGSHPDPEHASMRRYLFGQRIYFARARPWERASIVVDNTDFTRPRIVDASPGTLSVATGMAG
jgi:uridine kinase